MDESILKKREIDFNDLQNVTNSYIDALYYYFDHDISVVKDNLYKIKSGDFNALIPTFNFVIKKIIDNKEFIYELNKEEIFVILKKYINECIYAFDTYIKSVISEFNNKRFNIDKSDSMLGVKNRFGDIKYYNSDRLEYLKDEYKKVVDHETKQRIKEAKKNANNLRNIFRREDKTIGTDYTLAQHIEYKYFLSRYVKEYEIDKKYEEYKKSHENEGFEVMCESEFYESILDKQIQNNNFSRKRK